jgi:hypothetical protein
MEDEIIFLYVFSILLDEDICLGSLRNSFDTDEDVHESSVQLPNPPFLKGSEGGLSIEGKESGLKP